MSKEQSTRACAQVAAVIGFLVFASTAASATIINPGDEISLFGTTDTNAGTVIYDALVPFTIDNGDGTTISGYLQNRVVVLDSNGKLDFEYRIRDISEDSAGEIYFIYVANYAGLVTDVEYSSDSLGTNGPNYANRPDDGTFIGFGWFDFPIGVGEESYFFYANPNADCFAENAVAYIYSYVDGYHNTAVTVVGPGRGGAAVAEISTPDDLNCVCGDSVPINGSAYDPNNSFAYSELAYRPAGSDVWTSSAISFSEVQNGLVFNWDTTGLAGGWYTVRVTTYSNCGDSASDVTFVYLDETPPGIDSQIPPHGGLVGGNVCIEGFVQDYCGARYVIEYSSDNGGSWHNIGLAPEWPATLTTWDTSGLADGNYLLRIVGEDGCGNESSLTRKLVLDNTPPVAKIASPANCDHVSGVVSINGTATDAHISGWTLQYTGGDTNSWVTIASGNSNVNDAEFTKWDTTKLKPCCYTIRLLASDKTVVNCITSWTSEYLVSISVNEAPSGDRGDINCDGDVNFDDIDGFVQCLIDGACEPCPEP